MINRLYEKTMIFIKNEYKFLILCLVILIIGIVKIPYNLYLGGGTINLNNRLTVSGEYPEKGTFNLAYVKETRATIPTYLLSFIVGWDRESVTVTQIDENDSARDIWQREKLYLQEANDNAIINAYRLAGEEITFNKEYYKVLYLDSLSETNLEVGDIIDYIGDVKINNYSDIEKTVATYQVGDRIKLQVRRDDKTVNCYAVLKEIDGAKIMGVSLIKLYDYEIKRDVDLKFSSREGGPSGGFMLSLAIYNRLVPRDLTHGLKIVGTGTIDIDGNVGEIGGVKYKLKGAVSDGADIFFVPVANYHEAKALMDEKDYDIQLVKVDKLIDAINYLENLE